MDLIERQPLVACADWFGILGANVPTAEKCVPLDLVERAPRVDAVAVIRCGKCRYWNRMEGKLGDCTNGRYAIDNHAPYPVMEETEFCALGERRQA